MSTYVVGWFGVCHTVFYRFGVGKKGSERSCCMDLWGMNLFALQRPIDAPDLW